MSKLIERIQKRKKWPVKLGEDTIYIRALVKREQREAQEVSDPILRGYFIFGCILLEDDGSMTFTRAAGESPTDFAARVGEVMDSVPEDSQAAIANALTKAQTVPESLAKN